MKRVISEVHVESAWDNLIYTSLKHWIPKHPDARLMLIVDTCPFCSHVLVPYDLHKRYRKLAGLASVGLHVHLSSRGRWHVDALSHYKQMVMLLNGVNYLKECGIETSHFAAGHFDFNKDTVKACHKLGLTNFHYHDFPKDKPVVEWAEKECPNIAFISAVNVFTHDITIHSKRL